MATLFASGNGRQVLVGIQAAQTDHLFCRGMLAAADGGCGQYFALEILDGPVLGSADQPEDRTAETDGNHAKRCAALDATNGAADGAQAGQFTCDSGGDRRIG